MATRKQLRDAVRAAVALDATLSGHALAPWGQDLDEGTLAGLGVFTPREVKRREAAGQFARQTDIVILIKRRGGDTLEDDLDTDVVAAESVALTALDSLVDDIEAVQIETDIPGRGKQRLGQIALTLRAVQLTSAPG